MSDIALFRPLTPETAIADGVTPHTNSRGVEFVQLYQRLPLGSWFYAPFEKNFDSEPGTQFCRDHMVIPVVLVVIYMAAIFLGKKYMDSRERCDLRMPLAYWNLFLSVFSFAGALRTVPDLLYRLASQPFNDTVCTPAAASWGVGATGLWVQLFIFSKIPELVDTYFIVARKRPLIFLHWYHHVTVLLYCWHSYAVEAPQALYFVAMNYSVHAIMYGYYFLMALKLKPKWLPPVIITVAQISQMFVGVGIQIYSMASYFAADQSSCPGLSGSNIFWGGLMYGSYFALFMKFAVDRYLAPVTKPKKKAA